MFQFKQFKVEDTNCAHKVGTDGTLLGAWVNLNDSATLLDVGTGSGLIALMLAQRSSPLAKIEAIEIAQADYEEAKKNILQSPWAEKIKVHHTSLQEFVSQKKIDCIVSNPPYFINSSKPPTTSRATPRHTDTLSFKELICASKQLISPKGKLNVILPYTEGLHFIDLALQESFYTTRKWSFRTRKEKPIERLLLEFAFNPTNTEHGEILLYSSASEWSEEYKNLTRDFYLKL